MKALTLVLAMVLACCGSAPAYTDDQQRELQIGQQVYQQLAKKGEILTNSPYYSILNPIAARIKRVADPQYFVPFHFILVHEKDPNAFAVPGGDVYVTDSLMHFVHNKEELAGVLCHETSHDIHHDVMALYAKDQRLSLYATGLAILFGGGGSWQIHSSTSRRTCSRCTTPATSSTTPITKERTPARRRA